jgi:hypothetical protein
MTAPRGCPSCNAPLTGTSTCASCGLPLTGALAGQLWQVDQQLAGLDAQRSHLEGLRADLLRRLRAGEEPTPVLMSPPPSWPAGGVAQGGPQTWQRPVRESNPQSVQNTLLVLGALLLTLAGVVFTAVTYRNLGVVGRAAILLALTAAAAWAPTWLLKRTLSASAEALGAVAVVMALLDANALRRAGFGDNLDERTYLAVSLAVVAILTASYAAVVPLRITRVATAVIAQLPTLFVLARLKPDAAVVAVALAGQAAVDLTLCGERRLPKDVRWVTGLTAPALAVAALVASVVSIHDGGRAGGAGLTAVALVLALASSMTEDINLRTAALLPVVPLVGIAGAVLSRTGLTADQRPLAMVAVALAALPLAALLPAAFKLGAVLSATSLSGLTLLLDREEILQAVALPWAWLDDPWTRTATTARGALSPHTAWSGTVVTLVVLAGAAIAAVTAGLLLEQLLIAAPIAGALLVLCAVTLPLGFATSYRDALAIQLAVGVALGVAGAVLLGRARLVGIALVASGTATALLTAVWSTADQDSTLTVLPMAAVIAAALSVRLPGALTGLALALGGAELAAYGAWRDLSSEQVGGLLLGAVAVCVAASFALRGLHRLGAEAAAVVLAVTSLTLAATDLGWLSWALAANALLALAVSVRHDRRYVGIAGGLLLTASSWVRLADSHVHAPEPYVAPLAAVALVLGHLRRRAHPGLGSMTAYGPALTLALVPSLLKAFADDTPTRGLLLLMVSVAVVLAGSQAHLRAPLAIGGAVVVLDGLHLLAPYASSVPRWLLLAGAGLLLVGLGATYEQRLKDVQRLRARYDALS